MQFFKMGRKIVISAKNEQKDLLTANQKTSSVNLLIIQSKPLVLRLYLSF
jgi:hypothetical protein